MLRMILLSSALVVGLVIFLSFNSNGPSQAMKSLALGSSYSELVAIAGEPSYLTDGTVLAEEPFRKSESQLIAGCVKEAWYENVFNLPSKYAFCFSSKNKLLHKYHWSSW